MAPIRQLRLVAVTIAVAAAIPVSTASAFQAAAPTPTNSVHPNSVTVGDFNGDGKQDLATTNVVVAGSVSILTGDGAGGFTAAATTTSVNGNSPLASAVGDFNGDGKQDLAVAVRANGKVSILTGDGNGGFTLTAEPSTNSSGPASIAVGDFDGDGNQDLVVGNYQDPGSISLLTGNGHGAFAAGTLVATAPNTSAVAVGDFNGDGKQDVATAQDTDPGNVIIMTGNGDGTFSNLAYPTGSSHGRSVAVGDFNGDGHQDVATANSTDPGNVSILLSDGQGSFTASTPVPNNSSHPLSVAAGDFNGDGNLDLATANDTDPVFGHESDPGSVSILTGDGTGSFTAAATPIATGSTSAEGLAVGDFKGDGREDLASANTADPGSVTIMTSTEPSLPLNLLTNGGAEAPAPVGPSPVPPDWVRESGSFTGMHYGEASGFLGRLDAPLWTGNEGYFIGGPDTALAIGSQVVDVSGSAPSIDAGLASIGLSGLLGGFADQDDDARVSAQFIGAGGVALGTAVEIGPVTKADRHSITRLLPRTATGAVPAGTRSIRVTVTFTRVGGGSYDDGSADNLLLSLNAPTPPPAPGPPTPTPTPLPPPRLTLTHLTIKPSRFRAAKGAKVAFILNRAARATFKLTHRAAGVKKGKRCVAPPRKRSHKKLKRCTRTLTNGTFRVAGRAGVTTFHFNGRAGKKNLRPGSYRLVATASDSTGKTPARSAAFHILKRK